MFSNPGRDQRMPEEVTRFLVRLAPDSMVPLPMAPQRATFGKPAC